MTLAKLVGKGVKELSFLQNCNPLDFFKFRFRPASTVISRPGLLCRTEVPRFVVYVSLRSVVKIVNVVRTLRCL